MPLVHLPLSDCRACEHIQYLGLLSQAEKKKHGRREGKDLLLYVYIVLQTLSFYSGFHSPLKNFLRNNKVSIKYNSSCFSLPFQDVCICTQMYTCTLFCKKPAILPNKCQQGQFQVCFCRKSITFPNSETYLINS